MPRRFPDHDCTTLPRSASQTLPRRHSSHVTRHPYYRSDVINGILKCVQCRIDLGGVETDKAQCLRGKMQFSTAREFDESWNFSREMIGHTDDLRFFVDQLRVWKNRHRFRG